MSNPPAPHLDPSELGTKAYWDAAYTTERKNYKSSSNDEGTIWFDDAGAEERMIKYLDDLAQQGDLERGEEPGDEERVFEEIDSDDPDYDYEFDNDNHKYLAWQKQFVDPDSALLCLAITWPGFDTFS